MTQNLRPEKQHAKSVAGGIRSGLAWRRIIVKARGAHGVAGQRSDGAGRNAIPSDAGRKTFRRHEQHLIPSQGGHDGHLADLRRDRHHVASARGGLLATLTLLPRGELGSEKIAMYSHFRAVRAIATPTAFNES